MKRGITPMEPFSRLRHRARRFLDAVDRDGSGPGGQGLHEAAEIVGALLDRTAYMTVAEWIGSSMLLSERIRRTGWFGRFRAWRLRRKVIRQDLRRIRFEGEKT